MAGETPCTAKDNENKYIAWKGRQLPLYIDYEKKKIKKEQDVREFYTIEQ